MTHGAVPGRSLAHRRMDTARGQPAKGIAELGGSIYCASHVFYDRDGCEENRG